jgi:predicted Zn finger-like uncharacterized protein
MSLVTTCPGCSTSFLLKPEHLAAHRGDVRCGKCDFIFNALDKLGETVEITPTEILAAEISDPLVEHIPETTIPAEFEIDHSGVVTAPDISWPKIVKPQIESEYCTDISSEIADEILVDDPFKISLADQTPLITAFTSTSEDHSDAFDQTDFTELDQDIETIVSATQSPHADLLDYRIEPETIENEVIDVKPEISSDISLKNESALSPEAHETSNSFFDSISESAKPPNEITKRRQWLSILFAVFLVITALAQATYYFRTQLSIILPGLKPYLVQGCAKLGCTVELPKNIKLLVIDDSSIQEDTEHAGVIHLSSTLINNAEFAQAYPILELTLTDSNDAPELRRSFKPSEYLPPSTKIIDGIPAGEELHISMPLTTNAEKVSGYRVQITY